MRRYLALALLAASSLVLQPSAANAAWPERPIHLVVPTGAGGITDQLARILGERLGTILGEPVVIENRAGASGVIGSAKVAQATPDGYTLLMAFPSHVANPSTQKSLPYDTAKDFAPVSKVGQVAQILVVDPNHGKKNLAGLMAKARSGEEAASYGSVGNGSLGALCAQFFGEQIGAKLLSVTFKGEPNVVMALNRGDIDFAFVSPPVALPQIAAGKLKAIGISSPDRLVAAKEIPTVAEAGLPGYSVTGWNAIFAPAGTPPEITSKLNAAINEALSDSSLAERFVKLGVPPLGGSQEELQASVEADIERVRKALAAVGFKPQ
jgi:tripartite-type tricarboxylate transporter receptor subunit TctC